MSNSNSNRIPGGTYKSVPKNAFEKTEPSAQHSHIQTPSTVLMNNERPRQTLRTQGSYNSNLTIRFLKRPRQPNSASEGALPRVANVFAGRLGVQRILFALCMAALAEANNYLLLTSTFTSLAVAQEIKG